MRRLVALPHDVEHELAGSVENHIHNARRSVVGGPSYFVQCCALARSCTAAVAAARRSRQFEPQQVCVVLLVLTSCAACCPVLERVNWVQVLSVVCGACTATAVSV